MDSPDPADRSRLRDLAALAAHTAHPLPTFAQTEALLRARLAGPTSPRSQESLLTRWKRTPALTAAIAAIGLAAAAPAAYALAQLAQTIWIDTDADADTIAADVQGQLADQGIAADVTAERTDDSITVGISTDDPRAAALTAATSAGETSSLRLRVEVRCELTPAQELALAAVFQDPAFAAALGDSGDLSADELTAIAAGALAKGGFTKIETSRSSDDLVVAIVAPPT
jgi:hypothetical protein